jgi:hypothetical protein
MNSQQFTQSTTKFYIEIQRLAGGPLVVLAEVNIPTVVYPLLHGLISDSPCGSIACAGTTNCLLLLLAAFFHGVVETWEEDFFTSCSRDFIPNGYHTNVFGSGA